MTSLALYIPKPSDLYPHVVMLVMLFGVLCALMCGLRCCAPLAALLMLSGMLAALAPDLYALWQKPGSWAYAREFGDTMYSDTFLAITVYMHVGRGCFVALAGLLGGLVVHGITITVWRTVTRTVESESQ